MIAKCAMGIKKNLAGFGIKTKTTSTNSHML